jgi:DNA-binding transcriptional MerR regulator
VKSQPALSSIGEVLARLRVDFPDTTISKLRFLEAEGLVRPQRTPSGYRKYTEDDVARLRFALGAQRDRYLPLRVIREQLDSGAHLEAPPPPTPTPQPRPAAKAAKEAAKEAGKLNRAQLCARAGIGAETLADLEGHGLVSAGPGGWFGAEALTVAEVAGRLAAYGLQPRHLRAYKVAADREAGLFAQVVAPLRRQQARADEVLGELMLLSQRMHQALLRLSLDETLGQ